MATVRKRKLPSGLIVWRAFYTDGAGCSTQKTISEKERRPDDQDGTYEGGAPPQELVALNPSLQTIIERIADLAAERTAIRMLEKDKNQ